MRNETDRIIAEIHALYLEEVKHRRIQELRNELDSLIRERPGIYPVNAIDLEENTGRARVHFLHQLPDGTSYPATLITDEIDIFHEGNRTPTLRIRDGWVPRLDIPPIIIINVFNEFGKNQRPIQHLLSSAD